MDEQHRTIRFTISRWWLMPFALFGIASVCFSLFYLMHGHDYLAERYLRNHACFYRCDKWLEETFTPAVKTAGNGYCCAAILCGLAITALSIWHWRKKNSLNIKLYYTKRDALISSLLILLGCYLWVWGFAATPPAYDEVFSAINCAGEGPTLSISYYMLPNNHVLFNVMNSVIFFFADDKVVSGRFISGLAYLALILLMYRWLLGKLGHRGYAALYCTVLMLQFPVWGFGFQARGYAIYLLCAWASFIALEYYLNRRHERPALLVYAFTVVIGFSVMPAFLFLYAVQLFIVSVCMVYKRRLDFRLIRLQGVIMICVFLFYLPILAYSGLASLTDNPYVKAVHITFADFWGNFSSGFDATIRYCFASDVDGHSRLYPALFVLPLLLLPFIRKTPAAKPILVCLATWLIFGLLQLKFRHYPFMRNMVAHVSITLVVLLLSIHFFLLQLSGTSRFRLILPVCSTLLCLIMAVHFVRFMRDHVTDSLYFYDASGRYNGPVKMLKAIPHDAKVWCSDESFYLRYLLHLKGIDANRCYDTSQRFLVLDAHLKEQLPVTNVNIHPIDSVYQYILYRQE